MATFDAPQFLGLVKRVARRVPFAKQAVAMYYATLDRETPTWVKGLVFGALAYFVLPIDAIADVLPLVGFTDDAAILMTTWQAVSKHVTDDHMTQAQDWLESNA